MAISWLAATIVLASAVIRGADPASTSEHGNDYYHSVDHSMVHRPTREPDVFSAVTAICGDDGPTFSHLLASRRPRGREAAPCLRGLRHATVAPQADPPTIADNHVVMDSDVQRVGGSDHLRRHFYVLP